jgi:hypothetical protein
MALSAVIVLSFTVSSMSMFSASGISFTQDYESFDEKTCDKDNADSKNTAPFRSFILKSR